MAKLFSCLGRRPESIHTLTFVAIAVRRDSLLAGVHPYRTPLAASRLTSAAVDPPAGCP